MSRKLLKALVLGAMLVSALASTSSASATNWTSNGPMSISATATAAAQIAVAVPTPSHTLTIVCGTASVSGNLNGPVGPANTGPWNGVASTTPAFTSCTVGGVAVTFVCTSVTLAQLNALSQSGGPGTSVHGTISNINCVATVAGCTFTINGSVVVTYDNAGHLVINLTGQGLVITWANSAACNALFGTSPADPHTGPGTLSTATGSPLSYTFSGVTPVINHN
jgi:hypothetical protein